jgi:hypothetical protein
MNNWGLTAHHQFAVRRPRVSVIADMPSFSEDNNCHTKRDGREYCADLPAF